MKNQVEIYYEALCARDPRFDGKFFTGVKTTGIYCRPICPAKPKRENVEFFSTAGAAERKGYRPCLRCRPESAPNSPVWIGKSAVVRRALKAIHHQALVDLKEAEFAERFGIGARHLRRLFVEELGKTPQQIFDDQRLDFARKLVVETPLPITEIAFTSGFQSIRRFNDAFLKRFLRSPQKLRAKNGPEVGAQGVEITLAYRPPFCWKELISFYQAHAILGVESVSDSSYSRVYQIEKSRGVVEVQPHSSKPMLRLKISSTDYQHLYLIAQKVRAMFDLDSDPVLIGNSFSECDFLQSLQFKEPGLRLPRAWDVFESIIATILGQLVSVAQAKRLVQNLVQNYGEKILHPKDAKEAYLFPTASVLSGASLDQLGTTQIRKNTIREVSRQVRDGELKVDASQDVSSFKKQLLGIAGIGEWTAEYICLRAMGDPDAFPHTDLILKRALDAHSEINLESFRPWRGYAATYLWKEFATNPSLSPKRSSAPNSAPKNKPQKREGE